MAKSNVKIPTARQLPSGNWFVQLRIDGRSISITKPTQRDAKFASTERPVRMNGVGSSVEAV